VCQAVLALDFDRSEKLPIPSIRPAATSGWFVCLIKPALNQKLDLPRRVVNACPNRISSKESKARRFAGRAGEACWLKFQTLLFVARQGILVNRRKRKPKQHATRARRVLCSGSIRYLRFALDAVFFLVLALVFGLAFALVLGFAFGLAFALVFGFALALALTLALTFGLALGFEAGLTGAGAGIIGAAAGGIIGRS
jgi:hypothetical protein